MADIVHDKALVPGVHGQIKVNDMGNPLAIHQNVATVEVQVADAIQGEKGNPLQQMSDEAVKLKVVKFGAVFVQGNTAIGHTKNAKFVQGLIPDGLTLVQLRVGLFQGRDIHALGHKKIVLPEGDFLDFLGDTVFLFGLTGNHEFV
jgi:hypothetical protein